MKNKRAKDLPVPPLQKMHHGCQRQRLKPLNDIGLLKVLAILTLAVLPLQASCQTVYQYQAVGTHAIINNLGFDMGATKKSDNQAGFEVNFWASPFFVGTTGRETILKVCGQVEVTFGYNNVTQDIYQGFGLKVGNFQGFSKLKSPSKEYWCNVNLRVLYGNENYTQLNVWQGNNWYELNPTMKVVYTHNTTDNSAPLQSCEGDSSMSIMKTTQNVLGAYVGEFRIFKINVIDSYGQFLRHYENPFNARWPNTISNIFIREQTFNIFTSNSNANSYSVSIGAVKHMDVLRCNQLKAMQPDGNCSMNCLTSKCLFCQTVDKKFYNICRFCDGVSSSCQPVSKCPVDYYLENGICYKCPIGCSACERGDVCTACDAGLVLSQVKAIIQVTISKGLTEDKEIIKTAVCDCPIGQFGTKNQLADTVFCDKCDEKCYTCAEANVKCTSCNAPLFWINYDGGQCVRSCSVFEGYSNYFGDPVDSVCKPCQPNCLKCTGLDGCTDCDNYKYNATITNSDNTTQVVQLTKKLLNAEGNCTEICPSNSIDNSTFFKCHMCPPECSNCSEISSNCTVCNKEKGFNLYTTMTSDLIPKVQGQCVQQCPIGQYADLNLCKTCDESCQVCETINSCSVCTMDYAKNKLYHYINKQCRSECGERYYPDQTDPKYFFCRACPSNCLNCINARTCTGCIKDYYLTTLNGYTLCVRAKDCAPGSFPTVISSQQKCDNCLSNCKKCSDKEDCSECFDGYFLDIKALPPAPAPAPAFEYNCDLYCPQGKFALASGLCANCKANCRQCKDALTCQTCDPGYFLLFDKSECQLPVAVGQNCPIGYYHDQVSNYCQRCPSECFTCVNQTACTACILGHELNEAQAICVDKCGNGIREDREQCDDDNQDGGDGCASDCTVEDGFICEQGVSLPYVFPDVCRCDPRMSLAEWTDFWGTIRIVFDSIISYNATIEAKSNIPLRFCQQILTPETVSLLGSSYGCYLWLGSFSSELIIDVGKDATIGNKDQNYETYVNLNQYAMAVQGCNRTGIPTKYWVKNLPFDTPQVNISTSTGSLSDGKSVIGLCSSAVTLSLETSKGLTKRNINVTWTFISTNRPDSSIVQHFNDNVDPVFKDQSFYTIPEAMVEKLQGKDVRIEVSVKNFLEKFSEKTFALITFLTIKKVEIIDLPDTVTFQASIQNQLFPRFRIPYCSNDSVDNIAEDYARIKYRCEMFDRAMTTKRWPLPNCTIKANNMTLTTEYIVEVIAEYEGDASMTSFKQVIVQPSSPPVQVALIQGCNRVFSPNSSFSLTAVYNTDPKTTTFVWYCTDKATGSVCFSTQYKYITLGNSETINVGKDIFFFGMQYEFQVTAFDANSRTNSSITCMMYSSGARDMIIDVLIEGEATKTGFIDFTREQTAFKAFVSNMDIVNRNNLKYTWKISDSSGKAFNTTSLIVYQNSIGVLTSLLNRNTLYSVYVEVTDGVRWGNATQILQTTPDISNEFSVDPSSLDPRALTTLYGFSVYGQRTFDTLDQYVFGYIDPKDGVTKIPMTQKSYKRFTQFILPEPGPTMQISCYVEVIMPNRVSMTFFKTVQVLPTDMTVAMFNNEIRKIRMDDITESMQMKHKLVSMRSKMTLIQRSAVIKKILEGLKKETTPLSDYYIQSSVGSLLEYISLEADSVMSDAQIVTTASEIFRQMTIGENVDIANGRSLQFGKSVTQQLYNFANNLFQRDFTALIGGQAQLAMKVMFLQGLKNVLKGSLSNMILGDRGGFSYQGQNVYAKAVKFDSLENQYKVVASLPKSIMKNLTFQNFVNITLPPPTSPSNPCRGLAACQVSIIIIDTPITRFISNSKDSNLKSLIVDLSIQNTEVSSPFSYIQIKDLTIRNLVDPIKFTIPLFSELNTTNPNNTLACGFIDEQDNVFKQTGYTTERITNQLVTCLATHLTTIAVEEYSEEKKSTTKTEEEKKKNSQSQSDVLDEEVIIINMWDSWAIYAGFSLIGLLVIALIWAKRRDTKDEENLQLIRQKQKKIYVNLFLEPIQDPRRKEPAKIQDGDFLQVNQDETMRSPTKTPAVEGQAQLPPSQTLETFFKSGNLPSGSATPVNLASGKTVVIKADDGDSQANKTKKAKKKKKKKVAKQDDNDDFFAPGAPANAGDQVEKDLFFEGGDEDDFFAVDDAADGNSQASGKKKKKKKKKGTVLPPVRVGANHQAFNFEEIPIADDDGGKSAKNSSRSKSRTKTPTRAEEDLEKTPTIRSKLNKNKKDKKLRSKSKKSADNDFGNLADEDQEAEVIQGRGGMARVEMFAEQDKQQKKKHQDEVVDIGGPQEPNNGSERLDTSSKGFETLMNEEMDKQKSEIGKKKKRAVAVKKKKEEKKKKGDYYEQEAASCIQFCIWNCKEGHRCVSLVNKYNQLLSRPSRVILLIGSWMMFIMITGYLMEGKTFLTARKEKSEQFVVGTVAAFLTRLWVVFVTGCLMHSKREKVYQEVFEAVAAKRTVCLNQIRYYLGLIIVLITLIISIAQIFAFAGRFTPAISSYWMWSFLFAVVSDLMIVDGVFIAMVTLLAMTVGAAPDACGKCRNCWLSMVPETVKEASK